MLLSAGVLAQVQTPADSVYFLMQNSRILYITQQNPAALINSDIKNTSTIALNYNNQSGHFRTTQTAENGREISLTASGINTLGRFKVSGYFNFKRTWQDSLSWTLQGLPDLATPYYFAAGKAGSYQRINYNFGGLLTYNLINNQLYIGSGIDYLFNTASRNTDPRPSVQTFNLNLSPNLTYKIGSQSIAARFIYSYGIENNKVSFKSTQYRNQSGTEYPDRINYLIMGYGLLQGQFGVARMRRELKDNGYGLNYALKTQSAYLNADFSYVRHIEKNMESLENSANTKPYGTFYLNNYQGSFLVGLHSTNIDHQLYVDVLLQNGSDLNIHEFQGKVNYKYSQKKASFSYTVLKKSTSSLQTEFGLNATYNKIDKKDISSSISSTFGYIQPGISGAQYKRFKDKSKLSVMLNPAIRVPVGNTANSAADSNVFFNEIVYPDFNYWSATAGVLSFTSKYITPLLFKGICSGFSLNAVYTQELSEAKKVYTNSFQPSKNRLDFTFSFNLYF
ncbi:hypothetical protein DBR11_09630 [Pedobacter sp. HMWF019]|nr:hypothetical protein DBR11_09630 [Pedobacter sp. HMWF019]